jgi:hypothetical protein
VIVKAKLKRSLQDIWLTLMLVYVASLGEKLKSLVHDLKPWEYVHKWPNKVLDMGIFKKPTKWAGFANECSHFVEGKNAANKAANTSLKSLNLLFFFKHDVLAVNFNPGSAWRSCR